jgi:hypothetical protein
VGLVAVDLRLDQKELAIVQLYPHLRETMVERVVALLVMVLVVVVGRVQQAQMDLGVMVEMAATVLRHLFLDRLLLTLVVAVVVCLQMGLELLVLVVRAVVEMEVIQQMDLQEQPT